MNKLIWSPQHDKILNWLFNIFSKDHKDITKDNFILKDSSKLLNYIKNLDLSNSSKEQMFFMVGRYLDIKNKNKDSSLFKQAGYNLKLLIDKKEGQNELDEGEKEKFRSLDYFISIVDNFDMNNLNNKELLLTLLILQPPVRSSFYCEAKVIKSIKEDDKTTNFLLLNYKLKKAYYIINRDKVSNSKEYKDFKHSKIEIDNKILVNALLNKYKRKSTIFIFGNKKISNITLLRWLEDITKIKNFNIDNIRSIYITWQYDKKITFEEKSQLAFKMRHTIITASKNYYKIIDKDNIKKDKDNKEYEDDKTKRKFIKNKKDVIYNLNSKQITPRDNTIKKYDLKFINKVWE
tara:strand:- start:304 stop:1347 length:1044 start_codon:yes stop_codon:yes gene_type:complete